MTKTVTLKLPPRVYKKAAAMAARKEVSLDELFKRWLDQIEKSDQQAQLRAEFTRIGADAAASDVRFAEAAQAEVVNRHESS